MPRRVSSWALSRAYVVAGDQTGFVLRGAAFECRVECRQVDLGKLTDATLFHGHDLVTASALLDLVSEQWLQALVTYCAAARAPVLFALTYDGRMTCTPEDPDDGRWNLITVISAGPRDLAARLDLTPSMRRFDVSRKPATGGAARPAIGSSHRQHSAPAPARRRLGGSGSEMDRKAATRRQRGSIDEWR